MAEGLGTVLGQIYQRDFQRAQVTLEPAVREERVAALRRDLLNPALRYLGKSDATGWRGPFLKALAASLDGDYESAQKHAAEALAADPGRYEARLLAGESWVRVGRLHLRRDRLENAVQAFESARVALEEAVKWGRSDPQVAQALAQVHDGKATALGRLGKTPDQESAAALEWFRRGSQLDPDSPTLLVALAIRLIDIANHLGELGGDPLPTFEEAEADLRRAVEKDPSSTAGDGRAARRSLESAWSFNPLVKNCWKSKQAESAIRP